MMLKTCCVSVCCITLAAVCKAEALRARNGETAKDAKNKVQG